LRSDVLKKPKAQWAFERSSRESGRQSFNKKQKTPTPFGAGVYHKK
jgi:hypothetical protein